MIVQESEWAPWLKDLMSDPKMGYIRGYHLYTWIAAIIIMYIVSVVFLFRSRQKDLFDSQKWFYLSFGLFFIFMGLTRIVFIWAYWNEPYYNFLLVVGYAFAALSLLPIIMTLEKYVITKTHHIMSVFSIIMVILGFYFIIFPYDSALSRIIQQVAMPFLAATFILLYLWMIKNSTGAVRKKALNTLLGVIVFIVGIVLDSEGLLEAGKMNYFISPIVFMIGVIITGISQRID